MSKICIVTVAAGKESGLASTVASVDQQSSLPFRHILVLSHVPIEETDRLPSAGYRTLIIDQDKSLYDAMNIGLKVATGDLLLFLNAGDTLYRHNTLETVSKKWDGKSIVSGRSLQVFATDLYVRPSIGRLSDLKYSAPHQTFYTPLAKTLPLYEDTGRIGADSGWMSQVRGLYSQQFVTDILCRFSLGGISNAPSLNTIRRRITQDGLRPAVKEISKLLLHKSLGQHRAYRLLYNRRYSHCDQRIDRAYRFPAETA